MQLQAKQENQAGLDFNLKMVLSNTFILYLKTLNYHWHVTGPHFFSLHAMFEVQYQALAGALDELAERLRQRNQMAPASINSILEFASLKETNGKLSAEEMIGDLINSHQILINGCQDAIEAANKVNDEASADLLTQRLTEHEKTLWMLKSSLPEK